MMIINEELKANYDVIAVKEAGGLRIVYSKDTGVTGIFESKQQIEQTSGGAKVLIMEMILG